MAESPSQKSFVVHRPNPTEQICKTLTSAPDIDTVQRELIHIFRGLGIVEEDIGNMVENSIGNKNLKEIQAAIHAKVVDQDLRNASIVSRIRLAPLRRHYESLTELDRKYNEKFRKWNEVERAIPHMSDFLSGIDSLEQAQVYYIDDNGHLIVGDGWPEVETETLGLDYYTSRLQATRLSYVNGDGEIEVVNGEETKTPPEAKIISKKGLITLKEYKHVNRSRFEAQATTTWIESGENPEFARIAFWDINNRVTSYECDSNTTKKMRGSRRVLRVKLDL